MSDTAISTVIKTLVKHFQASGMFPKVYGEFPSPNQELEFPALTLQSQPAIFTPSPPLTLSLEDHPTDTTKVFAVQEVGQYSIPIQADIWAGYKDERSVAYRKFFETFNKEYFQNGGPMGLSLELLDYHNGIARFEQLGYNFLDGEEGAQRGEWRVIINLEASFRAREKVTRARMSDIQLKNQISEKVKVTENDLTIEETKII